MAKREDGGEIVQAPGGPGIPATTTRRDAANPAQFSSAYVDPQVSDPSALQYAKNIDARRRASAIPRYTEAVAGGPDVPIPRLDSEAAGGVTMAQQAVATRPPMPQPSFDAGLVAREPALGGLPVPSGIVTGAEHLAPTQQPARAGNLVMPGGLTPADMLPPTARADPNYRQGHGADVAMNQPELAYKYGVMRNGQYLAPQALKAGQQAPRAGNGKQPAQAQQLSAETLAGLDALSRLNADRARAESGSEVTDKRIATEAEEGPAGGAGSTKPALSDVEKRNLLDEMDEFDITRLRNALYKDLLNNEEQKRIIEGRLKPLDLSDLIISGRVAQIVPVVPGKFEPEFQSYGGDEDLYVKRMLGVEMENLKPMNGTLERYVTDKYSLMGLTVSVKAINKQQFPSIYDADGAWNEDLFWKKYNIVSKFNYHMIGSLIVNWFWFDLRVRHLFKAEALGNG